MSDKKMFIKVMLKLLLGYAIFTGIITAIFLLFYFVPKQMSKQKPIPSPTVTTSPLGKFCGGTKNIQCPTGYICRTEGDQYEGEGEGICVRPLPTAGEGEFCGGIAAIQCAPGYGCDIPDIGKIADAGGKCVKLP